MFGIVVILGIMILGALIGFAFSKKGHEKEGAIQGAKTSCGCIFIFTLLLIGIFVVFMLIVGGAI